MGKIIEFPANNQAQTDSATVPPSKDPYYRFMDTVRSTARACGFTVEFAVDEIYMKTREISAVARRLRNTP